MCAKEGSAAGGTTLSMDAKGVASVLRLSPHYYNTEDELDAAVAALTDLAHA